MNDRKTNDPRAIFTRGALWGLRQQVGEGRLTSVPIASIEAQAEKLFPDGKLPNGECLHCHHEHEFPGVRGKTCGYIQHFKPGEGTSPWGTCPCVEGQGW